MEMIFGIFLIITLQTIMVLFILIPFVVMYLSIRRTTNKARKENMSKIDFSRDKEYYREILKGHTPAELSYIDNFKIRIPREIVATLLNLKLKKRIEINKHKIDVINSNLEGLRKSESFLLKNIKDGKVKILDSRYIESYAQDESIEDEFIEEISNEEQKKRIKKFKTKKFLQVIAICIINCIILILCKINQMEIYRIMPILIFCIMLYIVSFIVERFIYILMQTNSYKRTEKGEEINKKIEGLRQYIKDYSLLSKREQDELVIWEEYLIYSVIFDINSTTIVEEISELIEIEYGTGRKNM